jgi:ATP-dependent DNA helicase RecQ
MPSGANPLAALQEVIARYWGYDTLRPLQEQAMLAALEDRDSLVVLPTGGGKSLCYQAPAVARGGTTVVISPLIALMKDQVDSLRDCGIAAAQIDSSMSAAERAAVEFDLRDGTVRLLFVSPERLVSSDLSRLLQQTGVRTFAIDEAHCISHWGHDFRPEYRQLGGLRELFPDAAVHAYTATATERVRKDIIQQLGLRTPTVLVGNFDRPNLIFRVLPRHDLIKQVREVLARHPGEAGIIYCLRRRDVDSLAAALAERKVRAMPYHAGMDSEQRHATQEAFAGEECDVVVATIAFGMGIDRSNVRFVLHTAMPKSLEHYQQETGRAGRDGLEAECVLLYSGADALTWKAVLEKSTAEAGADPAYLSSALKHLDDMDRYCRGAVCRHRAVLAYFGQSYEPDNCGACDLCLGDTEEVPEATVVAQKVLSCVARVQQNFGINHIVGVLHGDNNDAIRRWRHEQLSTFALLKESSKPEVRDWIYQLIGQGVLIQVGDEYPVLKLNEASWEVLRGQREVRLIQLKRRAKGQGPKKSRSEEVSWEGVDRPLFDALRHLRRQIAQEIAKPPYVIFSDDTLRELARVRPSTLERMRQVRGIGDVKLRTYGERFLTVLVAHCGEHHVPTDVRAGGSTARPLPPPGPRRASAIDLFARGTSIDEVVRQTSLSRATVVEALIGWIRQARPASLAPWVPDMLYQRVVAAARQLRNLTPEPLEVALRGQVVPEAVRLVTAHLQALGR